MLLPNFSLAVEMAAQWIVVNSVTQSIVDGEVVDSSVAKEIKATVQRARAEDLKVNNIDLSLKYLYTHTHRPIDSVTINDTLTNAGTKYRCISVDDNSDYGYLECLFEEVLS